MDAIAQALGLQGGWNVIRKLRLLFSIKRVLFFLTVLSTFLAGLVQRGRIDDGVLFCISIMGILLAHEMGHYLACRHYGVSATLPLFIPMPLSPFGTMGAVIRIRSPIPHRRALFDIGIAGPLAGILFAIPIAIIGIHYSSVDAVSHIPEESLLLGEPLILQWLAKWQFGSIPTGCYLRIHPMAFAAWTGFYVTALNLLPVGQLDGGHVLYSVFGRNSRYLFAGMIGLVPTLCLAGHLQVSYLVLMGIIIALLGLEHPPTIYDFVPLDAKRKWLSLLALMVFVLCFTPHPIVLGQ